MTKQLKNDEQHWAALMVRAQAGDECAYQKLLEELGEAIAAYVYSRFGDIEALEDCVQESLIAVHQAKNTYESQRLFRPWLFAIVRHKTIDVLRKTNQYKKILQAQHTVTEQSMSTSDTYLESYKECGQLLSALPETHRQAIVLTKLKGLTMREAADHLDISENAMKVRVHRALDASRQLLEADP